MRTYCNKFYLWETNYPGTTSINDLKFSLISPNELLAKALTRCIVLSVICRINHLY